MLPYRVYSAVKLLLVALRQACGARPNVNDQRPDDDEPAHSYEQEVAGFVWGAARAA